MLVDSSVLLDLLTDDPRWAAWSGAALERESAALPLCINPMVYAEVAIGFERIEQCDAALDALGCTLLELPREALFLAGKAFVAYRRRGGARSPPLPFFIGAHAAVAGMPLLTRHPQRVRTCFPGVRLICPS